MRSTIVVAKAGLVLALLIGLAGCASKINYEQSFTLPPNEAKILIFDPPNKAQKIRVEVTSEEPVTVSIALAKDITQQMEDDMSTGYVPKQVLQSKQKVKDVVLEADIPAKQEFKVYISGPKKTPVKVKVVSS